MRQRAYLLLLSIFFASSVFAAEVREVYLNDGTMVVGEIVSFESDVYTIRSNSAGIVHVDDADIKVIRSKVNAPATETTALSDSAGTSPDPAMIQSLQTEMQNNEQVMESIRSLQNDPVFQEAIKNPAIMNAIQANDIEALSSNPEFMKLLDHPMVKEIEYDMDSK
jgi:hypothetical protein